MEHVNDEKNHTGGRRLTRREREQARHRREILDVALRLFSERGFHNVSMQEISKQSEFGIGTIYKHFGNKEGLYHSLVTTKAKECHKMLKEALMAPESHLKRIYEFIRKKLNFFYNNMPFIRLYIFETQGIRFSLRAGIENVIKELYEDILSLLSDTFASGIKEGIFKKDFHPRLMAVALDGMTNTVMVEWLENRDYYPLNPDLLLRLFLDQITIEKIDDNEFN